MNPVWHYLILVPHCNSALFEKAVYVSDTVLNSFARLEKIFALPPKFNSCLRNFKHPLTLPIRFIS